MSRSARRRARALPGTEAAAKRAPFRLALLPLVSIGASAALLAAAWTTSWAPGERAEAARPTSFTLEIPAGRQGAINNWERFFICYDLLDPRIVDLTLRANLRATGTLDFPGARVEVALPPTEPQDETSAGGANEDELIAVRQSVLDSAVPARMNAVRAQCGIAAPPPAPAPAGNESRAVDSAATTR
jgi:hypothetical protein